MTIKFQSGIKEINQSKKPIYMAWEIAYKYLQLDKKAWKVIEILTEHENLFISYNPYHNQNHLAEVIWSTAYLAKNENFEDKYLDTMMILLLAATFHDSEHPGRTNRIEFELEKKSANFFKEWWKNNSLFVENILTLTPTNIEQAVTELILFTDLTKGQQKVNLDYINRKENENFGLKLCKMKKILNEADFLLHCLPHYAYRKTELITKETGKSFTDEEKWEMTLGFLETTGINHYNSDAVKNLKIDVLIKKFVTFLEANKDGMKFGNTLQQEIETKFKQI